MYYKDHHIKPPNKKEKATLRILIILGIISILNFFYWILDKDLIENKFLFILLICLLVYDSFRYIYIWYHYWNISLPLKPQKTSISKPLTVDVLTTYYPGEPYKMVVDTLLAIKNIKYPHNSYLCDEANDPHLKEFCKEHGIIHVTREIKVDAKAGNINNALKQATGDICLILDPDHIPFDNFLHETLPYFEDESLGFVQTVQEYYNIGESNVARGAAEQTFLFYGPVMMCMNSYGTVNAIGANCIFRRKALDSIGGHAAGLSEDMHTAMQLHAKGWKSIYLPKTLTKGLAPASLTAYYMQQLKWSRGTLELLISVYPKLFKKFSWRQKLHYGILPLFYLLGIVFLFSLLIPIISLFAATTPWKGNVINFGLLITPIFASVICIRVYAQNWLINKSERGISLQGGLLAACTWWVYLLGFIYAIIRKKVPYLPTPKESNDKTNWKILIPNLLLGILSIVAVIYGLFIDFTPFSIFMSVFALSNAIIMFYTLHFAYKTPTNNFEVKKRAIITSLENVFYMFFKKCSLPIVIITLVACGSFQHYSDYLKWEGAVPENPNKKNINYVGIFNPEYNNGLTSLESVKNITKTINKNFDIISIYLAWNKNIEDNFPKLLLDSIYNQKSIPLITWEPWVNTFINKPKEKHVFELIEGGYFDDYIKEYAIRLRKIQKPVFLRFAHEFDNPFYPWYSSANNAALKFKSAWVHTYEIFKKNGAHNVVWVWNPWKSENATSYYPGKDYVDWFGVNILNYANLNTDEKWYDFESLYQPYHDEFKNLPKTPVMISEFGTLEDPNHSKRKWITNANKAIEDNYNEIKSIIYFNSDVDANIPNQNSVANQLHWKIEDYSVFKQALDKKKTPNYVFTQLIKTKNDTISTEKNNTVFKNLKGINFKKGHEWKKDYHVLSRKNLLADFKKLKKLGINTIRYLENDTYDYNVLNLSRQNNLSVSYGFWISEEIDFINDLSKAEELSTFILNKIADKKNNQNIICWNIQNDLLTSQKQYYNKPELIFQNQAYLSWLKKLLEKIKKEDKTRPVIVDLEVNNQSLPNIDALKQIPHIDALGLVIKENTFTNTVTEYLKTQKTAFVFNEIDVSTLGSKINILDTKTSFFVKSWQDQHQSNKLNFDGIIDRKNRYKPDYYNLFNLLHKTNRDIKTPKISILKPANLVFESNTLIYRSMIYDTIKGWVFGNKNNEIKYEWSLVKCDQFGNFLSIKDMGFEPTIKLKIPKNHESHRLLLTVIAGNNISTSLTTLNTPLIK